jgi:hypothetical protein
MVGGVPQVVECLLRKQKALSPNPVLEKIKKNVYKILIRVITEL